MSKQIWILCDRGKIGTLRQCEALAKPIAEKCDATIMTIDVHLPFWCRYLTPRLTRHLPNWLLPTRHLLTQLFPSLPNEKPSLIIAAGRQAFLLGAPLAKTTPTIALLNPKCPLDYFAIVLPPQHDSVKSNSPHVIETLGALHPHNDTSFHYEKDNTTKDTYTITVLLGGNSRHHTYTNDDFTAIATYLTEKAKAHPNTRFLISPSRRTPAFGIDSLKKACRAINITIWDGISENPYFRFLGAADEIIVTGDSISMISEACFLGKPVIIWRLPIKNKRFFRFYKALTAHQHAVFHDAPWPHHFIPLRERERVLPKIFEIITR